MEILVVYFILVLIFVYLYYKFTIKTSNIVPEGYIIIYTRDACIFCDSLKQKIKTMGSTLKIITVNHGSLGNVTKHGEYENLTGETKAVVDTIIKRYEAHAFPTIHKLDNIKVGMPDNKEYAEIFEPSITDLQTQEETQEETENVSDS